MGSFRKRNTGTWSKKAKMYIFHGGCHGCLQQHLTGNTSVCDGCCYRFANWSKPDLSINANKSGYADPKDAIDYLEKKIEKLSKRVKELKLQQLDNILLGE